MKFHLSIEAFSATLLVGEPDDEGVRFDEDHAVEECSVEDCVQCEAIQRGEHRQMAEERQQQAQDERDVARAEARRWQSEFERVCKIRDKIRDSKVAPEGGAS
jgi:hypothetical protein